MATVVSYYVHIYFICMYVVVALLLVHVKA